MRPKYAFPLSRLFVKTCHLQCTPTNTHTHKFYYYYYRDGFHLKSSEISFPSLCYVPLNGVMAVASCLTTIITAQNGRRLIITLCCHYNTQFYYTFIQFDFRPQNVTHHVINYPIYTTWFLQLFRVE